jgi:hypothetical protein
LRKLESPVGLRRRAAGRPARGGDGVLGALDEVRDHLVQALLLLALARLELAKACSRASAAFFRPSISAFFSRRSASISSLMAAMRASLFAFSSWTSRCLAASNASRALSRSTASWMTSRIGTCAASSAASTAVAFTSAGPGWRGACFSSISETLSTRTCCAGS